MSSSPPPRPPPTPEADGPLLAALAAIRDRGAIGERSLPASIGHAERFVRQIPPAARRLVDLGSGGGLPGLVIAVHRPELQVVLVERRRSRADLLRRAVGALGISSTTEVVDGDVAELARTSPANFDVVTARSFGPPATTARWMAELLVPGGLGLISEPPEVHVGRWDGALLQRLGLVDDGLSDGLRRLQRTT